MPERKSMYIKRTHFLWNAAIWVFYSYFWQSGCSLWKSVYAQTTVSSQELSTKERLKIPTYSLLHSLILHTSSSVLIISFYFFTVFETFLKGWWQWLCIPLRYNQTLANWCGNWKILQPKPRKENTKKKGSGKEKKEWHRSQTMNNYSNSFQIQEVLIPQ